MRSMNESAHGRPQIRRRWLHFCVGRSGPGTSITCRPLPFKVMGLPTDLAAGKRAVSIAGFIQSVLRTRLSYERLYSRHCIYFNFRALPFADLCSIPDRSRDSDFWHAAGDGVGVDDGADGAGVGSLGSLSDVREVSEIQESSWAKTTGRCWSEARMWVHRRGESIRRH